MTSTLILKVILPLIGHIVRFIVTHADHVLLLWALSWMYLLTAQYQMGGLPAVIYLTTTSILNISSLLGIGLPLLLIIIMSLSKIKRMIQESVVNSVRKALSKKN